MTIHSLPHDNKFQRMASPSLGAIKAREERTIQDAVETPNFSMDQVGYSVSISDAYYVLSGNSAENETDSSLATIRTNLEKAVTGKRDLDAHVSAILKKNGIKLAAGDAIKLETGAKGNIAISGVRDQETRRQIEEALNKEEGLFAKVRENQTLTRKVSHLLKDQEVEPLKGSGQPVPDLEINIPGFEPSGGLFSDDAEMQAMVDELKGKGDVQVVTDSRANADPEETLTKLMRETEQMIRTEFMHRNRGIRGADERDLPVDGAGNTIPREHLYLDLNRVNIAIDSEGQVTVEGDLAIDPKAAREGEKFIKEQMKMMMEKTSESGDVILFEEANQRILDDYNATYGNEAAKDAKVVTEIGKDHFTGSVRLASESKEAELEEEIGDEVNAILKEEGIVDADFDVQVTDEGKIVVTNLPEDGRERDIILDVLGDINAATATSDDQENKGGRFGRIKELVTHHGLFHGRGLDTLRPSVDDEDKERTAYTAAAARKQATATHPTNPELL